MTSPARETNGFVHNDGGRAAMGFKGEAGDCVCRSIAIVTGRPYNEIYMALALGTGSQRVSKRTAKRSASARNGINTRRKWFKDYAASLGLEWVPTMKIGQGCKVHLDATELPKGRLVVSVSGHYTAMIDGVIHDTYDPRREPSTFYHYHPDGTTTKQEIGGRCVYGYFKLREVSQ